MGISQPDVCILIHFIPTEPDPAQPLDAAEFERQLRANAHAYHNYHAFNVLLNSGRATQAQVRGWIANRFYYQIHIPGKDTTARARRADQDVLHDTCDAWLRLGAAVGMNANELWSTEHVLPGVRTVVNAYVDATRRQPWQEAVCASLTELFAAAVHREQIANWPAFYPWIEPDGLEFFRSKGCLSPAAVEAGLRVALEHFRTRDAQSRALEVLRLKLDLLWSILDAIQHGYGLPEG